MHIHMAAVVKKLSRGSDASVSIIASYLLQNTYQAVTLTFLDPSREYTAKLRYSMNHSTT